MTPAETAKLATDIFYADLKLRGGFRELIATVGDWPAIEDAMRAKVQRALEEAEMPKMKQEDLPLQGACLTQSNLLGEPARREPECVD